MMFSSYNACRMSRASMTRASPASLWASAARRYSLAFTSEWHVMHIRTMASRLARFSGSTTMSSSCPLAGCVPIPQMIFRVMLWLDVRFPTESTYTMWQYAHVGASYSASAMGTVQSQSSPRAP